MKQFFLAVLAILLYSTSGAAPKIKCKSNGYWNNPNNWDLNRIPAIGDTITIPAGFTIIINDDRVINGFVYLQIFGTLSFQNNNSTLKLGNTAIVLVYSNGQITGGGSPSQKLRIGSTAVFDGNDDPVHGPRMATGSTNGFEPFTAATLPVKFTGFSVTRKTDGSVLVQWSTSDEISADRFEIERSIDGSSWLKVGQLRAMNQSSSLQHYSFLDQGITQVVYYRIRQVDIDGRFMFSNIRIVRAETNEEQIRIASVNGKMVLHFPYEIKDEVTVSILSLSGQLITRHIVKQPLGQFVLNTDLHGLYVITISNKQIVMASGQVRF
ncbi:MAG: G8 domain-containing protein [Chitinophagaceae bacterium]